MSVLAIDSECCNDLIKFFAHILIIKILIIAGM